MAMTNNTVDTHLIRGMQVLLLIMTFLFPFKELIIGWSRLSWLGLQILFFLGACSYVFKDKNKWRVGLPLFLFMIWILISSFRVPWWDRSFNQLAVWIPTLLIILVSSLLTRHQPSWFAQFVLVVFMTATLISLLNIHSTTSPEDIQKALVEEGLLNSYGDAILFSASQDRFHFPFGSPNDLGLFLSLSLLCMPVLFTFPLPQLRYSIKIAAYAVLVLCGFLQALVLWGTSSRTALLGMLVGCLIWLSKTSKKIRLILVIGLLMILFSSCILVLVPRGREMLARVETVKARTLYWKAGLQMLRDHPILGTGIGGFGANYPRYRELTPHQTQYPHNILLEILIETGMVGGFLTIWWYANLAIYRRKVSGPNCHGALTPVFSNPSSVESTACLAGLCTFGISSLLGFSHNLLQLTGLAGILLGRRIKSSTRDGISLDGKLVILPFLIFLLVYTFQQIGYDSLDKGKQSLIKKHDLYGSLKQIEKSIRYWPPYSEAYHFLGRLQADMGNPTLGINLLQQAIRWGPTTAYFHEDLASLYWQTGHQKLAFESIDKAISLHPVKWNYHDLKSQWLFQTGMKKQAETEKQLALFLKQYEPDYAAALKETDRKKAE